MSKSEIKLGNFPISFGKLVFLKPVEKLLRFAKLLIPVSVHEFTDVSHRMHHIQRIYLLAVEDVKCGPLYAEPSGFSLRNTKNFTSLT